VATQSVDGEVVTADAGNILYTKEEYIYVQQRRIQLEQAAGDNGGETAGIPRNRHTVDQIRQTAQGRVYFDRRRMSAAGCYRGAWHHFGFAIYFLAI
jgi:hypothetical protein